MTAREFYEQNKDNPFGWCWSFYKNNFDTPIYPQYKYISEKGNLLIHETNKYGKPLLSKYLIDGYWGLYKHYFFHTEQECIADYIKHLKNRENYYNSKITTLKQEIDKWKTGLKN